VLQSGLRAALCYEVTDRDGPEAAQAGIRENVRFCGGCRKNRPPARDGWPPSSGCMPA
jgi:hypothetical protein